MTSSASTVSTILDVRLRRERGGCRDGGDACETDVSYRQQGVAVPHRQIPASSPYLVRVKLLPESKPKALNAAERDALAARFRPDVDKLRKLVGKE